MAILIDKIKKQKKSNVIYLADYRKKKIFKTSGEVLALNQEIAAYNKEVEKVSKELKAKLYLAGDNYGKD